MDVARRSVERRSDSVRHLVLRWLVAVGALLGWMSPAWSDTVGVPVPTPPCNGIPIDYDRRPSMPPLPTIPSARKGTSTSAPMPGSSPLPWPLRAPLTLNDAIGMAVQRSPSIRAQIADVEARIAHIYETASGTQPHVEIRYNATRYQQPTGAPFSTSILGTNVTIQAQSFTISQFEDGLRLTQLISDGGRTRQLIASDVSAARSAYADLLAAAYQLQYDVRTGYIAVLEAQAQVAVDRTAVTTNEAHLRMTEAQFEAGDVARADITFSTTPVTRARIALQSATTSLNDARAHLNGLLGADPAAAIEIVQSADLPDPGDDLNQVRRIALAQRSDLHARQYDTSAQTAAMDAAMRSRSVNIQANAGFRELGYYTHQLVPQYPGWTAGVEFTYPLLDGGLISAQVREARARMRSAEEREEALARRIDEDVVAAWLSLKGARQRLELAQAEVQQAEEALGIARGQYEVGVGTNLQVLDSQAALQRAQTEEVSARFGVQRAMARLLLSSGR